MFNIQLSRQLIALCFHTLAIAKITINFKELHFFNEFRIQIYALIYS